jgi:hypothetical protein
MNGFSWGSMLRIGGMPLDARRRSGVLPVSTG